ncbi:MAG: acetylxylan esterase [Trueperaceae bacterium]
MAYTDFSLEQLRTYKPQIAIPKDFDSFWHNTIKEAQQHPLNAIFEKVDYGLRTLETFDVTFSGFDGQAIKGWLLLPKHRTEPLPCVVEYVAYGGGRGFPIDWLLWSSTGYAHFVMDTRGQGTGWQKGDTPDIGAGANPSHPGFATQGILDPHTYYYRRVFTDAVRAIEAARSHKAIDASKVAVTGASQGGGIALAAAGLSDADVLMTDVPFLCHYRRGATMNDAFPYQEIRLFCKIHRDKVATVFKTLEYFDGVHFATKAKANALFSVGLMDEICPPSTVYAAYNHYGGKKDIRVWEFNGHEGGQNFQSVEKIRFLQELWPVS